MEGGCLFVSEEMRICTDAKREFLGSSYVFSGSIQLFDFLRIFQLGDHGV